MPWRRQAASWNRAGPGGVADTAFGDAIALETHASAEPGRKGTGGTGQGEANRKLQWRLVVLAAKDSSETDGMLMPLVCGQCQSANHQRTTRTNLPK
jgi:hypothetical protein